MSEEQRVEVFLKATTVRGTVLVLGPDGKPKYDDPALAGTYAEEAR